MTSKTTTRGRLRSRALAGWERPVPAELLTLAVPTPIAPFATRLLLGELRQLNELGRGHRVTRGRVIARLVPTDAAPDGVEFYPSSSRR